MGEFGAYVGIDWGDRVHEVVLWDSAKAKTDRSSLPQTPMALHEWARALQARYPGKRVVTERRELFGTQLFNLAFESFDLRHASRKCTTTGVAQG